MAALLPLQGGRRSPPTQPPSSDFDVQFMSMNRIHRRTLHQFSVHHSISTGKWIATIFRQCEVARPAAKRQCTQFSFDSEREARKFAKAYSPPVMQSLAACGVCEMTFTNKIRPFNCRNCGVCICDKCSARWGKFMIPRTYVAPTGMASTTVRVCRSCNWLSNAFCMALLQGKYEDALALYETGNVNLRTVFADINKESMFPVHCAVMGGSLPLVKWLVEKHLCPIATKRDPKLGRWLSVQTSAGRTLIDLAMTGKPKMDILQFLVERDMSVMDTKDPNLAPKTLETFLKAGLSFDRVASPVHTREVHMVESVEDSVKTLIEDECILCCNNSMDCALVPCGHQVCCTECGKHLENCPVCKVKCSVLRLFRM